MFFLPPRKILLCDARICSCCFCWILCSSSVHLRKISHVSRATMEVLVRFFTSKCFWWLYPYVDLSHGWSGFLKYKLNFSTCIFPVIYVLCKFIHQAWAVQKVYSAIHRINHYPADSVVCLVIAVFNNMRTLKFKAQLTIGFLAAVNHNYGDSQRTLKHRNKQNGLKSTNHDRKTWPFDPAEVSFCFTRGPLRWLTAEKNVNR